MHFLRGYKAASSVPESPKVLLAEIRKYIANERKLDYNAKTSASDKKRISNKRILVDASLIYISEVHLFFLQFLFVTISENNEFFAK